MDQILFRGNTYEDEAIKSISAVLADSLTADELSADTLTASVYDDSAAVLPLAYDGLLFAAADGVPVSGALSPAGLDKLWKYGDEVEYRHGGKLIGKFHLEDVERVGKSLYELKCTSAIGLLLTSYHYGGVYTGETAAKVIADVIGGVISYTLDQALGATTLYGWLPKGTRRDNLRDVLFAVGGQIRKDENGAVCIVPMAAGESYPITAEELYLGGSVTGGNPASTVSVTEHSYLALPTDQRVTLFDGEAAAAPMVTPGGRSVEGVLVEFKEPAHNLEPENVSILESGANYAVLGRSPAAKLYGLSYSHTRRILRRTQDTGAEPNEVVSEDCTLVNLMNAENVADRLMAYYGSAKRIKADLVMTDQRPGDAVTFTDPFGEDADGIIGSMELSASAILKASCEIVAGYTPTASGNYYEHMDVISADGVWTVPDSCKGKIRIVLIGGGDGGSIGSPGAEGGDATRTSFGASGEGGEPGAPGNGGKVFVITVEASSGDTFTAHIGQGGAGETADSPAQSGGDTTFGPYSSADGYPADTGYAALIGGGVYATNGPDGQPGGKGNQWDEGEGYIDGPYIEYLGSTYSPGANGENGSRGSYYGYGGLGGGAAAGSDGGDGAGGSVDSQPFADGGDGGHGATPVKAQNGSIPGQGGGGGHGGGGGGGGGPAKGPSSSSEWQGQGGPGGSGGEGGDGASGIILIYY